MALDEKEKVKFKYVFLKTVRTWVNNLTNSIDVLKKNQNDTQAIKTSFIAAHSLKGDGALMNYEKIATLGHVIEDIFYEIKKNKLQLSDALLVLLDDSYMHLLSVFDKIEKSSTNPEAHTEGFITKLKELTGVKTVGFGKSIRNY